MTMNLQDYNKWAEWDYKLSHDWEDASGKHHFPSKLPLWFYPVALLGLVGIWALVKAFEFHAWLRKCDPIEVAVALWLLVCGGLFIAGMIIAILS